jgi:hypothetical protein
MFPAAPLPIVFSHTTSPEVAHGGTGAAPALAGEFDEASAMAGRRVAAAAIVAAAVPRLTAVAVSFMVCSVRSWPGIDCR